MGLEHQSTLEGGAVGGVVGDGEGAGVEVVVVAGADDFASRVGPLDVGGLAKCGNHFYEGVHVGSGVHSADNRDHETVRPADY